MPQHHLRGLDAVSLADLGGAGVRQLVPRPGGDAGPAAGPPYGHAVAVLGVPTAGLRPCRRPPRPRLRRRRGRLAGHPSVRGPRRDNLGGREAVDIGAPVEPGPQDLLGAGAEGDDPAALEVLGLVLLGPVEPDPTLGTKDVAGPQGCDLARPSPSQPLLPDHRGDLGRQVWQDSQDVVLRHRPDRLGLLGPLGRRIEPRRDWPVCELARTIVAERGSVADGNVSNAHLINANQQLLL